MTAHVEVKVTVRHEYGIVEIHETGAALNGIGEVQKTIAQATSRAAARAQASVDPERVSA
jgi:hypothetical protein